MIITEAQAKALFKAYDIRGIYPEELNETFAYHFGRAFVMVTGVKEVAVGHDMRVSSDVLFKELARGIMDQGANVIGLGQISSDMLYFACGEYEYEAGIMITASHNPGKYNGMKACYKHAVPIPSAEKKEFEKISALLTGEFSPETPVQKGTLTERNVMEGWVQHLFKFCTKATLPRMTIVVDAGNGMAGPVIEALFAHIPQITIIPLYFTPDGNFPNHPANPLEEENLVDLKKKMKEVGADLGMAFDGDADRLFLVDKEGETITGTIMTAIVAEMILAKNPHETILYNAMCGKIVPETVAKMGGKSMRVRAGHTFIKQHMKEEQAAFAGESSGHYFFRENWNADSGIIAGLIVLEYLAKVGKPLHELRKMYDIYAASGERNFTVQNIPDLLKKLSEHYSGLTQDWIDGLSVHDTDWWANIRPSNTEPLLRINVEAHTKEKMEEKLTEIRTLLGV